MTLQAISPLLATRSLSKGGSSYSVLLLLLDGSTFTADDDGAVAAAFLAEAAAVRLRRATCEALVARMPPSILHLPKASMCSWSRSKLCWLPDLLLLRLC